MDRQAAGYRFLRLTSPPNIAATEGNEVSRQHGWRQLLDYFRAFAECADRFDHFQHALGESLKEFEADALKRLRQDLEPFRGPIASSG